MTENSGPPRPFDQLSEDYIDLRRHLFALWQQRRRVIVATVISGAVAGVVSLMLPPAYEAAAGFYVGTVTAEPTVGNIARLRQFLAGEATLLEARKEVGLDAPAGHQGLAQFRDAVTLRAVAATNSLEVAVQSDDADLAVRLARALAARAAAKFTEYQGASRTAVQTFDNEQMASAEMARIRALKALADFRRKNLLGQGPADVDSIAEFRQELFRVSGQISAERARLRATEQQLLKAPATLLLKKPADRGAVDSTTKSTGNATASMEDESTVEVLNPLHTALLQSLATSRITLAGLEAQRDYLTPLSRASDPADSPASSERDSLHLQLQAEAARAQRLYDRFGDAWAEARRQEALAEIRPAPIDEPTVHVRHLGPHMMQNIAWAMALGFVISAVCLVLYSSLLSGGPPVAA